MNLSHRIQAKTDNGDTVIDFLIEVMTDLPRSRYGSLPHTRYGSLPRSRNGDDRDGFKMCHRLGAARLLTKYGCSCKSAVAERDDAIDFIIDNPPEPSGPRPDSRLTHRVDIRHRPRKENQRVHRRRRLRRPLPDQRHGGRAKSIRSPPQHGRSQRAPKPRLRQTRKRRGSCLELAPSLVIFGSPTVIPAKAGIHPRLRPTSG